MIDKELQSLLQLGLSESNEAPVFVSLIERHPFDRATSYAFELLHVHIETGGCIEVVVKDFGSSRLPKDDPVSRAERETMVYRELLNGMDVGTARLYGVARHPVRLLLEHVDGGNLRLNGLEDWFRTASWLGAFQTRMAARSEDMGRYPLLIRHDSTFFLDRARTARTAIAAFGHDAARRLGALLEGYKRLIDVMVSQPRTLVHGSFRPQNIVVSTTGDSKARICPVDWELAGHGSPLYDLAFLAEGFRGPDLDRLFEAYLQGAGRHDANSAGEMAFVVDCFRLHKVIKSLSDSRMLGFRVGTVEKLLKMGAHLRERLG